MQTKTDTVVNMVDPDETARNEQQAVSSGSTLLRFCFGFCADSSILIMEIPKFRKWKIPTQKRRIEKVNLDILD